MPPFEGRRGNVHLWLVGKRVVDFLLALIELFFASSYGWGAMNKLVEIALFERGVGHKFQGEGVSSTTEFWRQKTRFPGLSRGVQRPRSHGVQGVS